MFGFLFVHEDRLVAEMAFGEHGQILKLRVLAVALDAFFEEVCALFRPVTAGHEEGDFFACPDRRADVVAIVFVEAVDEAVEDVLQRPRTVPRINRRRQDDEVAGKDVVSDGLEVIFADAGKVFPVFLTAPAGIARIDAVIVEPVDFVVVTKFRQLVAERVQALLRIAVLAGAAHENRDFHRIGSFPDEFCISILSFRKDAINEIIVCIII